MFIRLSDARRFEELPPLKVTKNHVVTLFDYSYQNALRQANIFLFCEDHSCVTQIYITKIAAKCILVVVFR